MMRVMTNRDKTTYSSCLVTYCYTLMPFGLRNAPTTFQDALDNYLIWRSTEDGLGLYR